MKTGISGIGLYDIDDVVSEYHRYEIGYCFSSYEGLMRAIGKTYGAGDGLVLDVGNERKIRRYL